MALDRGRIGYRFAERTALAERGQLRFFAKATGQTDPVYTDLEAAEQAGHRDLPIPPTFFFCLGMDESPRTSELFDFGGDLALHGEQRFAYHAMAYAGDRLTYATTITDVYAKAGGALEFIVKTTEVTRDGEPIATLVCVPVVVHKKKGKA